MDDGATPAGRVTRSRTVQAAEASNQSEAFADAPEPLATQPTSPKSPVKATRKSTPEPPTKNLKIPPTTPKPRGKRAREVTAAKQPSMKEEILVLPAMMPDLDPGEPYPSPSPIPPRSPRSPWELYGMFETDPTVRLRGAARKGQQGSSAKQDPNTSPTDPAVPGRQDESQPSDSLTANDPHDKAMDEDYVPTGPGPMPKVPKLLKGPKKHLRKRLTEPDTTSIHVHLPNPEPSLPLLLPPLPRPRPPPPPKKIKKKPTTAAPKPGEPGEADPGIWNLGTNPAPTNPTPAQPQHAISPYAAPPRKGTVYCETCFRDELARWARVRDAAVRILGLLGGDGAVGELRVLWRELEEVERGMAEAEKGKEAESGKGEKGKVKGEGKAGGEGVKVDVSVSRRSGGKGGLGSPPPPEHTPFTERRDEEEEKEEEEEEEEENPKEDGHRGKKRKRATKGEVTAKKVIIVGTDSCSRWEALYCNEYPIDVVGLALLRILAERPTTNLSAAEEAEVKGLLEGLRRDIGMGPRFFDAITTVCRAKLQWYRKNLQPPSGAEPAGEFDRWWWEFDDRLQVAGRQLPATQEPSFFAGILAEKADNAALTSLTASEVATAQDRGQNAGKARKADSLARLEQSLCLNVPSNVFLKGIGYRLAEARRILQICPEKRKLKQTPLPCVYCSESAASHRFAQRRAVQRGQGSSTTIPEDNPWVKPLMWAFSATEEYARGVTTAHEWFELVESTRAYQTVRVPEEEEAPVAVEFMVTFSRGETRVVLMELRGVFDCALGRRVRFRLPSATPMSEAQLGNFMKWFEDQKAALLGR